MKEKNKRNILQGMEHLKAELQPNNNESQNSESNISLKSSTIKHELIQILIIMFVLLLIVTLITIIDKNTNFLQIFAEKMDIWI